MKKILFLFGLVFVIGFVSSLAVNLTVDGTTGDCVFDHGSSWNQSNASDNFRSLFGGQTCGWTIQNWSLGSATITDVAVYVEHVGEKGMSSGFITLLVGNSTTQNVYGTTLLSDFISLDNNAIEDSQGLPITPEGINFYNSTDPSTIDRLNDLVIRITNSDGNDAAGVDHIVVGVTYSDNAAPSVFNVKPVADSTYTSLQVIEISANVTDISGVDKVLANVTFPNSTSQLLVLNNVTGDKYNSSFTIPDSDLQGRFNVTFIANDSYGNVNNSVTTYFNSNNLCVYSGSGNWEIPCSNNCAISSNVDLLGNNITITGTGTFSTTANITNFNELYIAGVDSANRCEVYCLEGGCFK